MQMYFGRFYMGIKMLFGFTYRSILEREELLYVFVFGTKEFIFDWAIIKSWNLIG